MNEIVERNDDNHRYPVLKPFTLISFFRFSPHERTYFPCFSLHDEERGNEGPNISFVFRNLENVNRTLIRHSLFVHLISSSTNRTISPFSF